MEVFEPGVSYGNIDDQRLHDLLLSVRNGIPYESFHKYAQSSPFDLDDWSHFLHISERTMQRYQKDKRRFDALQSEKILEIYLLYNLGLDIFGEAQIFDRWLELNNVALGGTAPKSLMDTSFGLQILRAELLRIEHGNLA